MTKYLILCLLFLNCIDMDAQLDKISYGFRAGLSFSRIDGPSEQGPNGEELEQNKAATGFHIGMALNLKVTDLFGFRGELLYSQRGTQYSYNGPSYLVMQGNSQSIILTGTRMQELNVNNTYAEIPLSAYYRIGYFEISGGLNTGILVSSTGVGQIDFTGTTPLGMELSPFEINLNHNYKKDEAGTASEEITPVLLDGKTYDLPEFIGAYYDFSETEKDLYKTVDFGVHLGLAYYLNESLYFSAKYIHGLTDIDRNYYDRSLQALDNGNPIPRDDKNTNKSWQFSVGFAF